MSQQNIEMVYDNVCAALRKPLSEGGAVGLMAAFRVSTASEIAEVVSRLAPSEALAVFCWLDDIRAAAMLTELPEDMVKFILAEAPPGRIAHLSAEDQEHKLGI